MEQQITLRQPTGKAFVEAAIAVASTVCKSEQWSQWAEAWLSGDERAKTADPLKVAWGEFGDHNRRDAAIYATKAAHAEAKALASECRIETARTEKSAGYARAAMVKQDEEAARLASISIQASMSAIIAAGGSR